MENKKSNELNIMEIMRLPIGTKLITDFNKEIVLEIIDDKDDIKFLVLEGSKKIAFVSNKIIESKFWIKEIDSQK